MRIHFLNCCLLFLYTLTFSNSTLAQAPSWDWAKSVGGINSESGNAIAIDASGNVYMTGTFVGLVDMDPGPGVFNLTAVGSAGTKSMFISKFDGAGNFIWAKAISTTGGSQGNALALDRSGNIYLTGTFAGQCDFDPGPGVFNIVYFGYQDIYVLKLDSSGDFIWAKRMGGTNNDLSSSIAIDPSGSGAIYTTGSFGGNADFDPDTISAYHIISNGSIDIFISKLDTAGRFIWAKSMGGTDFETGYAIAVDTAGKGDVYSTGYFSNSADFDPDTSVQYILASSGWRDIYISRLDSSGRFIWAKGVGGSGYDESFSIAIDPVGSGSFFITGQFEDTVDMDPDSASFVNFISAGHSDIFITKMDSSGHFIWSRQIGGKLADYSKSVICDPTGNGNIFITGWFSDTVDFDPGTGVYNAISVTQDIYILKFNFYGNFEWVKSFGGSNVDYGQSLAIDFAGSIYTTGRFASTTMSLDSIVIFNNSPSNNFTDLFLAKLDTNFVSAINDPEAIAHWFQVYPNPASNQLTVFCNSCKNKVTIEIYDLLGRKKYSQKWDSQGRPDQSLDLSELSAGQYIIRIKSDDLTNTKKLTLIK